MANEWPRIVRVMRDLGRRNEAAPELWSFLEFTVTYRTPLYICLMPFILHKINHPPIGDHERHMQFLIRERMRGIASTAAKSKGAILLDLARELRDLKEDLDERRYGKNIHSSQLSILNKIYLYSFIFSERDVIGEPMKKEVSVSIPISEIQKHQQRPSLISILTGQAPQTASQQASLIVQDSKNSTGGTPSDSVSQNTLNPPRESLSSSSTATNKEIGGSSDLHSAGTTASTNITTTIMPASVVKLSGSAPHIPHSSSMQTAVSKPHPQRLRFVQSVEFRHSTGEKSTTPLSPESPTEDSSGETQKPHRLQRSKAQSRKTFRLKRSQNSNRDLLGSDTASKDIPASVSTSPPVLSQASSTATLTAVPVTTSSVVTLTPPSTSYTTAPVGRPVSDVSWDSVSQTSSTSGYRDNYSFQTGFLSPDDKSGSQQSLLMLFEAQDEDTLI